MNTTIDFKQLSGKMNRELTRIVRLRRVVRVLLVIVYSVTLLWFLFCLFGGYLLASADYATNVQTSQYILYGFPLLLRAALRLHAGAPVARRTGDRAHGRIIGGLFPEARFNPAGTVNREAPGCKPSLQRIHLTGGIDTTSCRLEIPVGGTMQVCDVGITRSMTGVRGQSRSRRSTAQSSDRFSGRVSKARCIRSGACSDIARCRVGSRVCPAARPPGEQGRLSGTEHPAHPQNGAKFVHLE